MKIVMKKRTIVCLLAASLVIGIFIAACATGGFESSRGSSGEPEVFASAFIDFSGYTGDSVAFDEHQPSEGTEGPYTLDNGITGDGLRISHIGDSSHMVRIDRFGEDREAAATSDGSYLVFFIDNPVLKSASVLTMRVTYFDNVEGDLRIHYVTGESIRERYLAASLPRSGSENFVIVTVQLHNADFNSYTQNQDAQFRFNVGGIVQRVELTTGAMPPLDIPSDPPPRTVQTDLNNMIGKTLAGFMAWHNTDNWWEWSSVRNTRPSPGNVHVEMWPVGREDYLANNATLYDTDLFMPDGSRAWLFNSYEYEHVLTHYQWVREAGIDGVAIQPFFDRKQIPIVDTGNAPNQYTVHRDAAEATGRFFFIAYDMSGAGRFAHNVFLQNMQLEWIYNVERKGVVSSPNYAHAEGKPVVMIKAMHSVPTHRYISPEALIELIQWFRDRGCYVIGSMHENAFWETGGSRHPRGLEMYRMLDMISPWYGGRFMQGELLDGHNWLARGMEFCRTNRRRWANNRPISFMPIIWPGYSWSNMNVYASTPNMFPRYAGQFTWLQVREFLNRDVNNEMVSMKFVMFDEYGEATVWMRTATDYFDIPLDQYFLTLAGDGTWLSDDFYMRLARTASGVFKNRLARGGTVGPLNDYGNPNSVIVEHSLGPVFWRNSFERRTSWIRLAPGSEGIPSIPVNHTQVDVGVPHGAVLGTPQNVTVSGAFTVNRPGITMVRPHLVATTHPNDPYTPPSTTLGMVYVPNARSGDSAFRLAGQRTAGTGASYDYKIAEIRVRVESGMRLSYWVNATGLGTNVMVDLLLDNGTYVSTSAAAQNTGSPQSGWQQRTLALPASLNGRYITAVIIAYRDSGSATGNFAALIDDIIIDK